MANRHEIADVIFRRKTFILASTLLLLIAVTAAWQFSDGRYESQAVLLIRNNRAEGYRLPWRPIAAGSIQRNMATVLKMKNRSAVCIARQVMTASRMHG